MDNFALNSSASTSLKDFVDVLIPYGKKTHEGTKLRREGFSKADTNATGQVSLAEMESFILSILKDEELFRLYRPSFRQAFNNAKLLQKSNGKILKGAKSATSDDYVSFPEFRVFTIYLQIYAAMFDIFCSVDGKDAGVNSGDDARISLDEFLRGYQAAHGYDFNGLSQLSAEDTAIKTFDKIDSNDGGFVLFSELSEYLKQEEIKGKTDLGTLLSGNIKPTVLPGVSRKGRRDISSRKTISKNSPSVASVTSRVGRSSKASSKKLQMIMPVTISGAYTPSINASKEFKALVKSFQPYAEKTPACLALRKVAFSSCDNNGTGQCSFAEVDSFVNSVLRQDYSPLKGSKIFKAFRPSYIVAYNGAKNFKKNASGNDDDYIGFSEFRIFNVYLCVYAGMLDSFSRVDGGGTGVDSNDDRRVEIAEWIDRYSKFDSSGFTALQTLGNSDDALSAFKVMDVDDHGIVSFSEFCEWIAAAEVAESTALGGLLEGSIQMTNTKGEASSQELPPQDMPVDESTLLQEDEPEVEPEIEDEPVTLDEDRVEVQSNLEESAEQMLNTGGEDPSQEPPPQDMPVDESTLLQEDEPEVEPEVADGQEPFDESQPEIDALGEQDKNDMPAPDVLDERKLLDDDQAEIQSDHEEAEGILDIEPLAVDEEEYADQGVETEKKVEEKFEKEEGNNK